MEMCQAADRYGCLEAWATPRKVDPGELPWEVDTKAGRRIRIFRKAMLSRARKDRQLNEALAGATKAWSWKR